MLRVSDHPVRTKGALLSDAVCPCGHAGKSEYPETYRCSGCYYEGRAKANKERASELRERAKKLDGEAKIFERRAKEFRERHPR